MVINFCIVVYSTRCCAVVVVVVGNRHAIKHLEIFMARLSSQPILKNKWIKGRVRRKIANCVFLLAPCLNE